MAKREVPGREEVEDQCDRGRHCERHDRPAGEHAEAVDEPQENTEIERGTDTVYNSVSTPLVYGLYVFASGKCVLSIQVPGDRDGRAEGYQASLQQAEIKQAMQQRFMENGI